MVRYLLGLTGGIGSGKSAAGDRLAALGALVVDADQLAREIVTPGQPALDEIVARWGAGILHPDGTLNRAALAAIVFADPKERQALEAITHPRIIAESERRMAASEAPVGVHMAALLIEAGVWQRCDAIWLVTAPEEVRVARVAARDGISPDKVRDRMRHQLTDAEKRANPKVTVVLENAGSLAQLYAQADQHYAHLVRAIEAGVPPYNLEQ